MLACGLALCRRGVVDLVEHDRIGKLDLIDQQVDQRALVVIAERFTAIAQKIVRGVISKQVHGIDHGDHGVETGDIAEAFAVFVAEVEGRCDRQRLRDAGGFDQQIVEAAVVGELADFLQQIVAQGAADAAIGHLDQLSRQSATGSHHHRGQVRVDVHLAHVVHDHSHPQALPVVEHMIHAGWFCQLRGSRTAR